MCPFQENPSVPWSRQTCCYAAGRVSSCIAQLKCAWHLPHNTAVRQRHTAFFPARSSHLQHDRVLLIAFLHERRGRLLRLLWLLRLLRWRRLLWGRCRVGSE